MKGGLGDDVYYVEAGDKVTELANQGTDWVHSFVSYTLGSYIENLQLESAGGNINGTGNTLANTISGNVYDNVLNGKAGNDVLVGGDGSDAFEFNTTLDAATNVDQITDFEVNVDEIRLENSIFTTVGIAGALFADAFFAGTAAHDASDRIIYDTATGALYFDRDGTGSSAQVQFATLTNHAMISETDFLVI
jgi:Ca2+-binding RTX toxin-like protein